MKTILVILLCSFSVFAYGQNCKSAYIHANQILDSMPMPASVHMKIDSFKAKKDADLLIKQQQLQAKYKDDKALKKKTEEQAREAEDNLKNYKYKLLNQIYGAKIREASTKIYDKGKKYESVFNADNKYYASIPPNSCDVTMECLKLIREGK
jgi:Skp family chaperone for outer membrane proteins